jgi:hypothetical protein
MEQRGETDISMRTNFKNTGTYPCYHHAVQKKFYHQSLTLQHIFKNSPYPHD